MKARILILAATIFVAGTSVARGQNVVADSSSSVAVTDSTPPNHVAVRSSIDAPPAAVRRHPAATPSLSAAMAETHAGMGQAKAMMGVGIVGFVAGALIGGDSGTIVMVGSAVIGLYGLYQYLQ